LTACRPLHGALELTQAELKAAFDAIPAVQRDALQAAAARVRSYHEAQKKACGESWSYRDEDGTLLGQKVTPLDRVGIYVPGGKAAYPSSVLMNAIPAHVAGVGEIIMVVPTPPRGRRTAGAGRRLRGRRHPRLHHRRRAGRGRAGLRHGHRAQGGQDHRPRQRLCGQRQKARVRHRGHRHDCRPERNFGAGRRQHPPDWVAMDLFSQAEHDELAQSILLCPDAAYIDAVQAAIDRLLPTMPRAEIIAKSLTGRGALIHTRSMEEACAISNRIAPEHLEVSSRDPHRWEPLLRHAGRHLPGCLHQREPGRLLRRPQPRAAHQRHGAVSARRWACTTFKSAAA
jgi:histidinol dehydrogenase